ncbi:MAG: Lrp/AsnC ligand binding domain-containing protein [Candidatus Bathyarchaeota archaeon]|nr:Lrp/AsnC ligand binding domain-containing protein [Candidatus Bathyarchaeota archaeon]
MIAFVLAKVESGKDRDVLAAVKKLKGTKRALATYGVYDLIIEVEYDEEKELDTFVFDKVRKVPWVRETATLICSQMLLWETGQ